MHNASTLKVAVRVRPFNQREKAMRRKCIISMIGNSITIVNPKDLSNNRTFNFDYCYWSMDGFIEDDQGVFLPDGPHSRYIDQERIFNDLGRAVLENAWQGYNATLFSYGQTGSGKSHSMTGFGRNRGLVPMICEELFKQIKLHQKNDIEFYVYFSMFEIYNEQVKDLLSKTRNPNGLRIREGKNGFYVQSLKSILCSSFSQLEAFLKQGIRNRSVASTNWNTSSSRSHMVIRIYFQQVFTDQHSVKHSEIDLVDLAGSERQQSAGVTSDRFNEARAINLSLTTLGNVISSLSDKAVGKRVQYIPYRNSVLTRILSSALGGNSKTFMIATISPTDICYDETMSTLRFAERAKSIQSTAVINERLAEQPFMDLKADNARLQARIIDLEKAGDSHNDERDGKQEENMNPNLTRIFHDFIAIMPMVAQVNQISEELNRPVTFELQVKNLTSTDAKGEELEKEITIKVTNKINKQVVIWTQDKFTDRKLLIEDIYQNFLENGTVHNKMEQDPFWDPVETLHLGSAHVWLETLAYCITYEDQVDVNNHHGKEEAVIQVRLLPCTPRGDPLGEETVIVNPDNLLGKRMDFQVEISLCLGVKWIRESSNRGVQVGFIMYSLPTTFYTPAVWDNTNPLLDYSMHFTIGHVTPDFLSYLKTHALVLELWGLQGCQERKTELANIPLSSDGSVLLDLSYRNRWTSAPLDEEEHKFKLSQQLRMMEQEAKNLREANQALRSENSKLQKKAQKMRNFSSKLDGVSVKFAGDQSCQRSPFPTADAEFAKALKTFYFSMIGVRGRLIRLKQLRPLDEEHIHRLRYFVNEQSEMIQTLGEELEGSVAKLKNDVAKIIRKKKELQMDSTAVVQAE
ncbi:kinesin-like protein KIF28P [Mobula birostris]|uniref:kinesin-like protein KIF28P n=1 Tax=Mobula birostris TaxID=1983395 RepID=UPI003B283B52